MPAEKISMRRIKEVLRLKYESQLGRNQITKALGLSQGAVSQYLYRASRAGLSWPLPEGLSDPALEALLFPPQKPAAQCAFAPLNHQYLNDELHRPNVTLFLLWEEYKAAHPQDGYGYSQFCHLFRQWQARLQVTMRQVHKAGDKLFVDYAGQRVEIIDPKTGEIREAQVFVAVMGASSYTFAEATWSQKLPDWIASHQRAFAFFGGVPALLVPDNLRSGVDKADRFEPELNSTYWAMGAHYGCAVLPARPYKPRDKAKAEAGVQVVQRWILASLRHRQFFGLGELNQAIRELLVVLNSRPFKKLEGCRQSQFEKVDKPALKPLPREPFEFFYLKKVRLGFNYHVELDHHNYSAPYQLVKKELEARITARTVELLNKGVRVALHPRSFVAKAYTTAKEHMPPAHRAYMEWTPGRFLNWAGTMGPGVVQMVHHLLEGREHEAQAYKSCMGLLHLAKKYSPSRLEAACQRALHLKTHTYRCVLNILESGFDSKPLPPSSAQEELFEAFVQHTNLRGSGYYAQ
jgi:transposase